MDSSTLPCTAPLPQLGTLPQQEANPSREKSAIAVGAFPQADSQYLRDLDEVGDEPGCFFDVYGAVVRRRMRGPL